MKSFTVDQKWKVLITIFYFAIFGCTKDVCEQCETLPPSGTTQIQIELNDQKVLSKADYWNVNVYEHDFTIFTTPIGSECFEQFYRFVEENTDFKMNKVYGIVMYSKFNTEKLTKLSEEQVDAISVYTISDSMIHHHLFNKASDGLYHEIPELNVTVSGITSNHLNFYLTHYVYNESVNYKTSYIISYYDDGGFYTKSNNLNIDVPFSLTTRDKADREKNSGGTTCDPPCLDPQDICQLNPLMGWNCMVDGGGDCWMHEVRYTLAISDEYKDLVWELDFDLVNDFRSFLINYNLGNEYIQRYEYASSITFGDIYIGLAVQSLYVLQDCYEAIERLMDPDNFMDSILVKTPLRNDILELVNDYRGISEDETYLAILDSVESDVFRFSNITIDSVYVLIEEY